MQFGSTTADINGMAAGGDLPIVEENTQQPVWQEWGAQWRDLYILGKDGTFFTKINLTNFDPDPSVNNGQNYAQLKSLFVQAEAVGARSDGLTPNQHYVTAIYQELLHRQPDAAGLAAWSAMLDQAGSRTQVALAIEQSQEYREDEVESLYTHYLSRQADPVGLAAFTNFLAQGGTLEQVAADIVASAEYYQTHGGGADGGFLAALYQDALARPIDANGQSHLTQALASGVSRQQIAAVIFASTEYQQDVVENAYLTSLNRPADASGLQAFTAAMAQGTRDETIIADILGSDEFFLKP
jgi:hypothetical protein